MISFSLWTVFGRPSDVVGRAVRIGERDYWIAGVAPPRFDGLQLGRVCDVWIPLDADAAKGRGDRRLSLIGRLARGTDVERAQRDLDAVSTSLAERYPETNRGTRAGTEEPRRMTVARYTRMDASEREQVVLISVVVLGATGLLLVSACVNAATLLLSRSAARRRELAVKVALGASRQLLARQALVEGFVISLAGAGLGLLVAHWTAGAPPGALRTGRSGDARYEHHRARCRRHGHTRPGGRCPVRHRARAPRDPDTRCGGASSRCRRCVGERRWSAVSGTRGHRTGRRIHGDVDCRRAAHAGAVGGARGRSRAGRSRRSRCHAEDAGDAADDVTRGILFHRRALEDVRKIPGTEAAGWAATLPVGRSTALPFQVAVAPGLTETIEVDVNVASGEYFNTMRIAVVEGRSFTAHDGALAKPVIVVNDILARRYFGSSAVGRQLTDEEGAVYEVVGVVRTGKYRTFQEAPEPMVYFPVTQRRAGWLHLVVRTGANADRLLPVIKERLQSIDSGVDIRWMMTFDEHLAQALTLDRLTTSVVGVCGLGALVMATIGVYGVIGDGVRRRTPGDRPARRARREHVAGCPPGVQRGAAPDDGRCAERCLRGADPCTDRSGLVVHGLPPVDTVSLAVAPVALLLVVIGAAALPTRRALRISPTIALRADS